MEPCHGKADLRIDVFCPPYEVLPSFAGTAHLTRYVRQICHRYDFGFPETADTILICLVVGTISVSLRPRAELCHGKADLRIDVFCPPYEVLPTL